PLQPARRAQPRLLRERRNGRAVRAGTPGVRSGPPPRHLWPRAGAPRARSAVDLHLPPADAHCSGPAPARRPRRSDGAPFPLARRRGLVAAPSGAAVPPRSGRRHAMMRRAMRRAAVSLVTLAGITVITFLLFHLAPGDPLIPGEGAVHGGVSAEELELMQQAA